MGIKSKILGDAIFRLDYNILDMEATIKEQSLEIKRLKENNWELINKDIDKTNALSNNTLKAITSTPKLDSVSSMILFKIKNMDNMLDIKTYIDELIKF